MNAILAWDSCLCSAAFVKHMFTTLLGSEMHLTGQLTIISVESIFHPLPSVKSCNLPTSRTHCTWRLSLHSRDWWDRDNPSLLRVLSLAPCKRLWRTKWRIEISMIDYIHSWYLIITIWLQKLTHFACKMKVFFFRQGNILLHVISGVPSVALIGVENQSPVFVENLNEKKQGFEWFVRARDF